MRPTPRLLLGKILYWTEKEDGSNIAIWKDNNDIRISSRNLLKASPELQTLVKETEEYPKVIKLLEDNPNYVIYTEACRKGRSITGIKEYKKNVLYVFDIYDKNIDSFLPYVNTYQHCYHYNLPIVKLYAKTRHRSMKDLLKFRNHVLDHCKSVCLEGMVIKTNPFKVKIEGIKYLQAKTKVDIPRPVVTKIKKGEPIYPEIPENDIMNAIHRAWEDLGSEKFKDKKIAMPLIAKYVSEECKKHCYRPSRNLFKYYLLYIERHLINKEM